MMKALSVRTAGGWPTFRRERERVVAEVHPHNQKFKVIATKLYDYTRYFLITRDIIKFNFNDECLASRCP